MTRQNYINEINRQLNMIDGSKEYWFHTQTFVEVNDKFQESVLHACHKLFNDGMLAVARQEFLKIAAMCMVAADAADAKIAALKKGKA